MKFSIQTTFALFWPAFRKSFGLILLNSLIYFVIFIALVVLIDLMHFSGAANPAFRPTGDIIQTICNAFLLAAHTCTVTAVVLARLSSRRVTMGGVLRTGIVWAVPALIIGLLWALGATFAGLLLLFPALIFASVFAVPLPALLEDKTGLFGAFGRARALSKGCRWGILGLTLIVGLSVGFLMLAVLALFDMAFAATDLPQMLSNGTASATTAIAVYLLVVFILYVLTLVPLVMNTCLYAALRADKGEPLTDGMAKVFE